MRVLMERDYENFWEFREGTMDSEVLDERGL